MGPSRSHLTTPFFFFFFFFNSHQHWNSYSVGENIVKNFDLSAQASFFLLEKFEGNLNSSSKGVTENLWNWRRNLKEIKKIQEKFKKKFKKIKPSTLGSGLIFLVNCDIQSSRNLYHGCQSYTEKNLFQYINR